MVQMEAESNLLEGMDPEEKSQRIFEFNAHACRRSRVDV